MRERWDAVERRFHIGPWSVWFLVLLMLFWVLLTIQMNGVLPPLSVLAVAARMAVVPGVSGILVWYISGKLKWPEVLSLQFVLLHVAMGGVFATAAAVWSILPLMHGARGLDVPTVFRSVLPWQLATNFFLYGLVAGVSYAIRGSWGTRDQRLATERAERLRAQAELAALRAHINPHFLFNTLHSVTQLLRGEPERAEAALERLSDLFRYALRLDREGVESVSLDDEWRFSASYLWLEQMRMGDRLCVEASLSDDALLCALPPFTLQPLIENAVRHGLSAKVGRGTLVVRAHEAEGVLHLEVSDNGVGANPESLTTSPGIGVRAVRQRLQARYGTKAQLRISGAIGSGVAVSITMPAESAS